MVDDYSHIPQTTEPADRLTNLEEKDRMFALLLGDRPADFIADLADGKKPADSLDDFYKTQTVAQLREALTDAGIEHVPRGPKARLVQMISDLVPDDIWTLLNSILPFGVERLHGLRRLLDEGGRREVLKDDVDAADDIVLPAFPLILLFDTGHSLVSVVPQEMRDLLSKLTDEDWERLERQAASCDDLLSYIGSAVDLRGIVNVDGLLEEWHGDSIDDLDDDLREALATVLMPGPWLSRAYADSVYNTDDDQTLLISTALSRFVDLEEEGIDGELLDHLRERQALLPPRPVTDDLRDGGYVYLRALETTEGRALTATFDAHVPEEAKVEGERFSLVVMEDLIELLRLTDNAPAAVDEALRVQDFQVLGELAGTLYQQAEALNRVVPKWKLNGWSHAELDEHRNDPDFLGGRLFDPALDYTPVEPRDVTQDEGSGYEWVEDADDPWEDEYTGDCLGLGGFGSDDAEGESFADIFMRVFNNSLTALEDEYGPDVIDETAHEMLSGFADKMLGGHDGLDDADEELDGDSGDGHPDVSFSGGSDEDEDDDYDEGDYEDEEARDARLREENQQHLQEFDDWLTASGLKDQTIGRHLSNVEPFLNYYLIDYEGLSAREGVDYVGDYLGQFFIRKMMWSTPQTIRTTAASIKKFYRCMCELGHITPVELEAVLYAIKHDMDEWCDNCRRYNDPSQDNPFPWRI